MSENKIKNIKKNKQNTFFNYFAAICSILGVPLSILVGNDTVSIIVIMIWALAFIIFILGLINGLFSRAIIKESFEESHRDDLDNIIDLVNNYNHDYKESLDKINSGDINNYANLDSLLKPLTCCVEKLANKVLCDKLCVCIKIIETESLMNNDFMKWNIRTIARSTSTKKNRAKKDSKAVPISNNSDFLIIVDPQDSLYQDKFIVPSIPSLIELWKKINREYKNSTSDFSKHYKSTIVFPIKTESRFASNVIKEKTINIYSQHHIIGFLCLDSKKTFENNNEAFDVAAEIIGSFADSLYYLIEKYIIVQLRKQRCINIEGETIFQSEESVSEELVVSTR